MNDSTQILDGLATSQALISTVRGAIEAHVASGGRRPGLAVVLVGNDPASSIYVRAKRQDCEKAGILARDFDLPAETSEAELLALIDQLNEDPNVDGILVQLPLPKRFDLKRVLGTIPAGKDVDGFHLYNVGGLVLGDTIFPPCTPYGVMRLLVHEGIEVAGRNAVVVGASNIVGKPMALMLMQHEATVAVCHAKTRDLAQFTQLADILVVAAGCPNLITAPMVKEGAVVIDVGINRLPDGRLVGDCDFEGVRQKAAYLTPVPGGVGPMTVTMLLVNTINSAERALGLTPGAEGPTTETTRSAAQGADVTGYSPIAEEASP